MSLTMLDIVDTFVARRRSNRVQGAQHNRLYGCHGCAEKAHARLFLRHQGAVCIELDLSAQRYQNI
jgi:hypothetical protein